MVAVVVASPVGLPAVAVLGVRPRVWPRKIPKPVAGVAAAAALPVALAGGVGVGLLSAMGDASARLGTSASILGTAKDNFFREPGNVLDENIVRPLANQTLDVSTDFSEISREKGLGAGLGFLATGDDPREDTGKFEKAGGVLGSLGAILAGGAAGAKVGAAGGAALGSIVPGAGTAAGGAGGAIVGAITGAIAATPIGGRIGSALGEKVDDFSWPDLPDFEWPNIPQFPGWPDVSAQWGGWPDIQSAFPGWPDIQSAFPGWPDLSLPNNFWPDIDMPDFGGGGGGGNDDGLLDPIPGIATGGRVQSTGTATVHRGELVTDEGRLVRELADAIDTGDGGTAEVDLSPLESKLDRLHNDLRQLRRAMDVTLEVDKETLGRATSDARDNRMADTDPTV
ncbi:hypothetical protein OSG_eHP18_00095 [environmental Halophage eHP-18]|nr:hypothetical protein OSG_eHP18_00095 [environmental Halophage eHP-18]